MFDFSSRHLFAVFATAVAVAMTTMVNSGTVRAQESRPPASPIRDNQLQPNVGTGETRPRVASPQQDGGQSLALGAGEYLYLPDAKGKLVPVPVGTDLQEFLNWKNRSDAPAAQPEFAIPELSLEGQATSERAMLNVTMKIKVRGDGWIRVPLRFDEGVLRSSSHRGPDSAKAPAASLKRKKSSDESSVESGSGIITAAFADFDRMRGYRWWLRGAGVHTLKLAFLVPVRRNVGTRRLQLSLPAVAASSLQLDVAVSANRLSLPPQPDLLLDSRAAGPSKTRLTAFGLGNSIDLTWQELPNPRQVRTVLETETDLRVELSDETVLLRVQQLVNVVQGSAQQVQVWLPVGFDVVQLKVNGDRSQAVTPETDGPVIVELPEGEAGPYQLDWTLQAPLPTSRRFLVSGFQVEGALRQSGEISIAAYEGYRIVKRSGTDVHRMGTRQKSSQPDLVAAYRFWKQPFQLELELQPIEPVYSVKPLLMLGFQEDSVDLVGVYDVEIYRGVVNEFTLDWSGIIEDGWEIDEAEIPASIERMRIDVEKQQVTFDLAKPLASGDTFRLPLVASRETADEGLTFGFSLPRSTARHEAHPVLIVVRDDNVEAMVMPENGTQLQSLQELPASWKVDSLPLAMGEFQTSRHQLYRLQSRLATFHSAVSVHEQELRVVNEVDVTTAERAALVRQRLRLQIEYGRVLQLPIRVVTPLDRNQLKFLIDEKPAKVEWLPADTSGEFQGRVQLEKPAWQSVDLEIQSRLPLSADAAVGSPLSLNIPIVRVEGSQSTQTLLRVSTTEAATVTLAAPEWEAGQQDGSPQWWQTDADVNQVALSLSARTSAGNPTWQLQKVLVRTRALRDGRTLYRAQFRMNRRGDELQLRLGEQAVLQAAWWNQSALPIRYDTASDQAEAWILTLPPRPGKSTELLSGPADDFQDFASETIRTSDLSQSRVAENFAEASQTFLLTLEYTVADEPLRWHSAHSLLLPEFVGSFDWQHLLWSAVLPADVRLLTPPTGASRGYRWQQTGLVWERTLLPGLSNVESWIGSSSGPPVDPLLQSGNRYLFGYFGRPAQLSLSSMSQSALVLFGAGLALGFGLVFLKLRAIRNVVTVLLVLTAVAGVAVWYPEAVAVFLQPACVGILLAVFAATIDWFMRRPRRAPVLTFQPASGANTESDQQPWAAIGSEDPTAVRPSPLAANRKSAARDESAEPAATSKRYLESTNLQSQFAAEADDADVPADRPPARSGSTASVSPD